MIGQVIQATKVNWNARKGPLSHQKMKCSVLDYVQFLMISWAIGAIKFEWNVKTGPLCYHKMKCSFLDYIQLLMIGQAGQCTQTPSATAFQPKNWNAYFQIMFNFWWSTGLVNGLEPPLPPLSSQENEMLIFRLHSTSDDGPGWSMDSNPIHHPSPAKKIKCLFLDYIQLLMIGQTGRWTRTPSTTSVQPKTESAHFWITFNFWWSAGLVDGLEPHLLPLSSQKIKCSFLDYVQLLMIGRAGWWTRTPSTTPLQPKKWKCLFFGLCSTSDDWPCWSMDSNPVCHPSPAKNIKCSFLDYVQLLMIGWPSRWTRIPSATPLQSKK